MLRHLLESQQDSSVAEPPPAGESTASRVLDFLSVLIAPVLLANAAKVALDIFSPQGSTANYIFGTALVLHSAVIIFAALGLTAIVRLFVVPTESDDSPAANL